MKYRFVLILFSFLCFSANNFVWGNPRLLNTFPWTNMTSTFGTVGWPIMFVFSEPMDLKSIVKPSLHDLPPSKYPGLENLNADASYYFVFEDPKGVFHPDTGDGDSPVALEGGKIIEIPNSDIIEHGSVTLHISKNGFKNLVGESLDNDYDIPFITADSAVYSVFVTAILPNPHQSATDPSEPISIYFNTPVSADSFQAELRAGLDGSLVAPLDYRWDTPHSENNFTGYAHLTIDYPILAPSPRPYVFRLLNVNWYQQPDFGFPLPLGSYPLTYGPSLAGDLNDDGAVTAADAVLALRCAVGLIAPTSAQLFAADLLPQKTVVNGDGTSSVAFGDGKIAIEDVIYLLQRAVGLNHDAVWP